MITVVTDMLTISHFFFDLEHCETSSTCTRQSTNVL